jgi:GntR family transcriptional repressor for pyruvate dehydrogenase complex
MDGEASLNAVLRQRASDLIESQIREQIRSGRLRPGDRLPSTRELARVFGVSQAVVREALKALEQAGVVQLRHGSGTFVRDGVRELLDQNLGGGVFADPGNLLYLLEFRFALEGEAARLAATRATTADIAAIEDAFRALSRAVDEGALGAEADVAFHLAVAEAAHNPVFLQVIGYANRLFRTSVTIARAKSLAYVDRPRAVLEEHREILAAIQRRRPEEAEAAMRRHIRQAMARLKGEASDL